MIDLALLKSMLPTQLSGVPIALYMHENQLTYPWSKGDVDIELKRSNNACVPVFPFLPFFLPFLLFGLDFLPVDLPLFGLDFLPLDLPLFGRDFVDFPLLGRDFAIFF